MFSAIADNSGFEALAHLGNVTFPHTGVLSPKSLFPKHGAASLEDGYSIVIYETEDGC